MILVFWFFSITDVSFWLFSIRTRERGYWEGSIHAVHYKSRKSHLQVGRVSWLRDHQYAQIFGSLFCNVATLSRNVATWTSNVAKSILMTLWNVSTSVINVATWILISLWNVATLVINVATFLIQLSVTSRRFPERRDVV